MCQVLGITEDDYWLFCQLAQERSQEREEGYELIPDIRNEPVSLITSLVIGLALTAVSALMTPKPKAPQQRKAPPQLQTADATGPKRFATQAGFNNVQSVAGLGEVIPLVYCQRVAGQGGVRVASRLLWSRMTSWTTTQQFEGIYLFSSGPLYERPSFYGLAIGDTLLSSYPESKLRAAFAPKGGRLNASRPSLGNQNGQYLETQSTDTRIPGNGFEVYRPNIGPRPDFCGVRTPSTQTQFGLYAPMPNGMVFQLPYELILVQEGSSSDAKNRSRSKRGKIALRFPVGAAVTSGSLWQAKDSILTYTISGDVHTASADWVDDWGLEDIQQTQRARREEIDSNIGVGSQYMIGQTLVVCTGFSTPEPWREGLTKTYTFKTTENNPGANVDLKDVGGVDEVYQNTAVCRAATGIVSNSRACNQTEIGIRSQVWKQLSFANVNTQPSQETIADYEEEGGSINLGQINKYLTRYSFFSLQARKRGDTEWTTLAGTTNIFCVKGNTPQDQYNFINIVHPFGQHEFRFLPIPGNNIWKFWLNTNNKIYQLKHGQDQGPLRTQVPGIPGTFDVYFQGVEVPAPFDASRFSNPEWIVGPNIKDYGKTLNAFDAIADYIKYEGESSSHQSAPEHEIVYVNEIIYYDNYSSGDIIVLPPSGPQYDNLAIAGLNLWSDKEWSSLSELSAWCNFGISVKRLDGSTGPTNLFPDIVYDLLTNSMYGAGELVGADQVDKASMGFAAQYCARNGFTWNGVITDRLNLREWIFENAAYCLLDFTIIGGQFALKPTPITASDGTILRDKAPTVKALFTDGIIKNLQVTFLGPEDRQAFKAVCLYREDAENGFPETKMIKVRLSGDSPAAYPEEAGNHENDPEETFDLTGFLTVDVGVTPEHAITFAKTAIRTRVLVTHSVQFETTPEAARGLSPGDYFRLSTAVSHTSRFNNGVVSDQGDVTSTTPLSPGSYDVYSWQPGTDAVQRSQLVIEPNGKARQQGIVFTVANQSIETRLYKVESMSYAETGLVEITGSVTPLSRSGGLAIMDPNGFYVEKV